MPRPHRIRSANPTAVYHCMTRTVNGEFLLDDTAKEVLRKQLHQVAAFCGGEIITYVIMTNHFHVLVRLPQQQEVDDAELLRRYKILYPKPTPYATAQIEVLTTTLKANGPDAVKLRQQWLVRMGDVSAFMKTLKQRFSVWYNRTHQRYGTLWADRFTSTIVEGNGHLALQTMAAYIDLNPVRAGLVEDPKDYRWCGYGEAVSSGGAVLSGLRHTMENAPGLSDEAVLEQYRMALFGKGAVPKVQGGKGGVITEQAVRAVMKRGGKLTLPERLRLRVGWFTKGAVIGSRQFVEEHLVEYRLRAQRRQKIGPRPLGMDSGTAWPDFFALRGCSTRKWGVS